jgi:Cu(I)/Ag(I) efflux system membrane fusion protein
MNCKNVTVIALLLAVSFGLGRWRERAVAAGAVPHSSGTVRYQDPMHPSYVSDKPGKAPDCGMDLVPMNVTDTRSIPAAGQKTEKPFSGISVNPDQQQLIGVKLGIAEVSQDTTPFRTGGRVVPDESMVYRVTAKTDGWVRGFFQDGTGRLVRKGDPLTAVYSRDLQTAQQAYIFALNQVERFRRGDEPDTMERLKTAVRDAALNLESLGVSSGQIDLIAREKKVLSVINLVSPATGFIVMRNVYADQKFERGTELYRIVDLRHVWILADLSDPQARWVSPGLAAHVSVPQTPGEELRAHVSNVLPQFDAASRILQVRLDAENPGFALRPDMYVDLEFAVKPPPALVVPRDSVVDSGLKEVVFVNRGNGQFEPRQVRTGWTLGDRVQILQGLSAGEQIVVSGTFLLDSETRMHGRAEYSAGSESLGMPMGRAGSKGEMP